MGIISFIQEAGERLLKRPPLMVAESHRSNLAGGSGSKPDVDALNLVAAETIRTYVASKGLPTSELEISYDGATATVTVSGSVPDQETREKIVICCGNVARVRKVDDQMTVAVGGGRASEYYTVQSGDTLATIARQFYGSADRFSAIFEANKPMLSHPDKIYPGQTLRVPRLS